MAMIEILLWECKLLLAALLIAPIISAVGWVLIERWWENKILFEKMRAEAQANAMRAVAEEIRKKSEESC